jgi:hypothetical protein
LGSDKHSEGCLCVSFGDFGSHPYRLVSISYGTILDCHGRGREFESRRPRHSFQAVAESLAFRRGNKKEQ